MCPVLKQRKESVRFWFKSYTTRQLLDWKKYYALDFELKTFRHVRFWKNVCIQKITSSFILLRENDIFCILCAFSKSMMLYWNFQNFSEFELKKRNASDFDLKKNASDSAKKILRLVRFWIKNLTTCQILNQNFYIFFNLKCSHHMYFSHRFPPNNHLQLQPTIPSSAR